LTHPLLAFARQQPLEPKAVDVNGLITGMSDLMHSTLGEQVQIETVMAAGVWTTKADPHPLESAVLNVAINARDAMPQGGKLTIETGNTFLDDAYARQHGEVSPGQYVMVAVSDHGTGMSSDVAARVFDPFFTTKPSGKGTRLGLSQVFGFIKQSNGHIKIYSEVGCGTTVKIYLPRLTDQVSTAMPIALPAVSAVGAGEVILVVEDDPMMLKFTTEAVRELGYTAVHAETATAALAILDSRPDIKLLFTDVVMPDISGKKLADEALVRRPELKASTRPDITPMRWCMAACWMPASICWESHLRLSSLQPSCASSSIRPPVFVRCPAAESLKSQRNAPDDCVTPGIGATFLWPAHLASDAGTACLRSTRPSRLMGDNVVASSRALLHDRCS
jgi:CheY-like chemotaxis protein